jgi:hypothetical protein
MFVSSITHIVDSKDTKLIRSFGAFPENQGAIALDT